jgi:hypothetical protein
LKPLDIQWLFCFLHHRLDAPVRTTKRAPHFTRYRPRSPLFSGLFRHFFGAAPESGQTGKIPGPIQGP